MTVESAPDAEVPDPPAGAQQAGQRLWLAVLTSYDLAEHELVLLRQAVAVADLCEQLQTLVTEQGPLIMGKSHPGLVELRQQRILLARLIVALRGRWVMRMRMASGRSTGEPAVCMRSVAGRRDSVLSLDRISRRV